MVHGREHDTVGVRILPRTRAVHIGQQGDLGEEFLERGELPRVAGQRAQILSPVLVVGELRLHVIFVDCFHHCLDSQIGRDRFPLRRDFVERGRQLLPDLARAGRRLGHAQHIAERRGGFGARLDDIPQAVGRLFPHPGQQTHHAAEGGLVARVEREFQERRDIFDVRLLEKAQSARHLERDSATGQFELDFHRMKMRAVEHSHLAELETLTVQFEDLLRDVGRLVVVGRRLGQCRASALLAPRAQVFFELARVAFDRRIGHVENSGDTAVIRLDAVGLRTRIAVGKFEDVFEIRPAPRIDRLRVVTDHHDVPVLRPEHVHQLGLHEVGILVFVDQHMTELLAVVLPDFRMLAQQLVRADKQIVEIHRVGRHLAFLVGGAHRNDRVRDTLEVSEAVVHEDIERVAGVRREREQLGQHVGFRKTLVARHADIVGHGLKQIGLVLAVEDAEPGLEADHFGMTPQNPVADRVEGPAPNAVGVRTEQLGDAPGHFPRRFVGESEQQDLPRLDPVLQQPRHAVGQRARLAAARPGDDQRGAAGRSHRGQLLLVEFRAVIDAVRRGAQSRNPHSRSFCESS